MYGSPPVWRVLNLTEKESGNLHVRSWQIRWIGVVRLIPNAWVERVRLDNLCTQQCLEGLDKAMASEHRRWPAQESVSQWRHEAL